MNDLENRIRKRKKILGKWARKQGITCYRLYSKDIPEYPLIIDLFEDNAIVWTYPRTKDDTPELAQAFLDSVKEQVVAGTEFERTNVYIKRHTRQQGHNQEKHNSWIDVELKAFEGGLEFEINPIKYVDVGLFLDHRPLRTLVGETSKDKDVLNLFSYTGAFSMHAAKGGARSVTTVDLSKNYTEWAMRNMERNGFEHSKKYRFVAEDCITFVHKALDAGRKYDIIICDPPSFSNSKNRHANEFVVDRDYAELLKPMLRLLNDDGVLYFSTNSRKFKLDKKLFLQKTKITDITEQTIPFDFQGTNIHSCWEFRA